MSIIFLIIFNTSVKFLRDYYVYKLSVNFILLSVTLFVFMSISKGVMSISLCVKNIKITQTKSYTNLLATHIYLNSIFLRSAHFFEYLSTYL